MNDKNLLQNILIRVTILASICLFGWSLPDAFSQDRPNIVLIMVDDLGFSDISPYGGEIATPNLDKLASNGVRFTQFYNTSRCAPTRASLLTGLYHHQAGMGLMPKDRTPNRGFKGRLIRERAATIAQLLKDAGYGTYMTGKWHLGLNKSEQPLDWGFNRFYGALDGAINFFEPGNPVKYHHGHGETRYITLDRARVEPDDNFYATNRFTDYAQLFLTQHLNEKEEDPFFLYMAYNAPHWPLQAPPEDIAKYEDKYLKGWDKVRKERYQRQLDLGVLQADNTELTLRTSDRYDKEGQWPRSRKPIPAWSSLSEKARKDLAKRMAVYAAMVDNVDQNIGRLIDFLKENGKFDNTLVLFLSDNGGAISGSVRGFNLLGTRNPEQYGTVDSFISYGLGWANVSNTPFRMYKCYLHEGGISSPLIAHWPKGITEGAGSFNRTPTHLIDIMPTLLQVAEKKYPDKRKGYDILDMEGQSLVPLLTGDPEKFNRNRVLYWEHAGSKAVRDQQWKLVQVHKGPWELYNMDKDRSESNNLINQYPDRAEKMRQMYDNWADRAYVTPPLYK